MAPSTKKLGLLKKAEAALKTPLSNKKIKEIVETLDIFIAQNPNNIKALILYSHYQLKNARPDMAGEASSRVITKDPNNIQANSLLLRCYMMIGDNQKAFKSSLSLKVNKVNDLETLEAMGDSFVFNEEYLLAKEIFRKLTAMQPSSGKYLTNLGAMLFYCNDVVGANTILKKLCKLNPSEGRAHWLLSQLVTVTTEKNHISFLESRLSNTNNNIHNYIYLNFALAKEKEDIRSFDSAFEHLKSANDAKFRTTNYNADNDKELFSLIRSQYKNLDNADLPGYNSHEPIFIVGMPRTGTTLVEQVLGGEENVFLAGELQAFYRAMCEQLGVPGQKLPVLDVIKRTGDLNLKELGQSYINLTRPRTGNTLHFVDKMPANFLHLGIIHRSLPNAKFIHLVRDPIDTCLSNFKTLFGAEMYPYSYDMEALASYYHQYQDLMAFWNQYFESSILNINYEELVRDPDTQFGLIFEHCGLTWDKSYLEYYQLNTSVGTASSAQIRKKIYTASIQKWQKFEHHIQPMVKRLRDLGTI